MLRRMIRLLETVAVSVVVAFIAVYATLATIRHDVRRHYGPEVAYLHQRYGPDRFSYGAEEWIARHFFDDRRGGFFLDVGAGDPEVGSNTLYLEQSLGWSGIAIDAQASYGPGYAATRPRTRFVHAFVSDVDESTAVLHQVAGRPDVASGAQQFSRRWGGTTEASVPTMTLNAVLDRFDVSRVDFLSLDIELFEPKALAGFELARFRPELVCVEAHPEVRQQLIEYFTDRGYIVVGTYLRLDALNLYFTPRDRSVPKFPDSIYQPAGRSQPGDHGH
jgi:FkbM family methyltransferase